MSQLVKDLHVSGLRYVGENASANPPSNVSKYKRYSIPYMPNRHCLGYIEGPAASLVKDTRNGRGYVLKLWQNVENSDDFKEGMKNATIVGELDHPEERIDYSLANGAVILTDWEIREDEGIVWARFAILDNQRGKDLLAYVKFGTVLGVSSRGLGDEIMQNGRTIIDPDTYEFYCFDVVAFPAAECARQQFMPVEELSEAKSVMQAFSERVMTEASKCSTRAELLDLQNVVESTSVADKAKLVEAISDKLSSLPESAGNERTTGDEESDSDCEKEILLSDYQSVIQQKDNQIESLKAALKKRGDNANYFRRVVQEQREEIQSLEEAASYGVSSVDEIQAEYELLENSKKQIEEKFESYKQQNVANTQRMRSKIVSLNSLVREDKRRFKADTEKLESELRQAYKRCKDSEETVKALTAELYDCRNQIKALEQRTSSLIKECDERAKYTKHAVNESASIVSKKEERIKVLESQLSSANDFIESEKLYKQKIENNLQNSEANRKKAEAYAKRLMTEYIKKASTESGVKYEAVVSALPQHHTIEDANKVIQLLADKQHRFNTLPIAIEPISSRIVEHRSRNNAQDSNTFVVRALSQDML